MTGTKQKAVVNAERSQIERVQRLIDSGRYRTLSEFVREAVDEKLQRLEQERLAEAVERYCVAGYAPEDLELVRAQAVGAQPARKGIGRRRATR